MDCGQCKHGKTCLLRGRLEKCPNFKDISETCETCKKSGNCIKEQFFNYCNEYKKVVKK